MVVVGWLRGIGPYIRWDESNRAAGQPVRAVRFILHCVIGIHGTKEIHGGKQN